MIKNEYGDDEESPILYINLCVSSRQYRDETNLPYSPRHILEIALKINPPACSSWRLKNWFQKNKLGYYVSVSHSFLYNVLSIKDWSGGTSLKYTNLLIADVDENSLLLF